MKKQCRIRVLTRKKNYSFLLHIHCAWNTNPPPSHRSRRRRVNLRESIWKYLFKFMRNGARNGNLISIKSNEMCKIYEYSLFLSTQSSHASHFSHTFSIIQWLDWALSETKRESLVLLDILFLSIHCREDISMRCKKLQLLCCRRRRRNEWKVNLKFSSSCSST